MNAPHSRPTGAPGLFRLYPLSILILFSLTGCDLDAATRPPPTSVAVAVETVRPSEIQQYEIFTGRVRGLREVDVKAQVAGVLQQRMYEEGAFVEQGQALFQLDPEPRQLGVETAKAALDYALSELEQSEREWQRHLNLYQAQMISEQLRDEAATKFELAEKKAAGVKSALHDAERLLRYALVVAPVSGLVGMEATSEGNLIDAGKTLTTITQLDQVHVHFAVPAAIAPAQLIRAAHTAERVRLLVNGAVYVWPGHIDYVDSRVDLRTDSISMRARFPNPEGQLLAGQFVRIRVPMRMLERAFLIDATSVSEGRAGPQVFLAEGAVARAQPLELGPVIDGQQVVLQGLSPGDRLIVEGHVNLRNGRAIAVDNTPNGPL